MAYIEDFAAELDKGFTNEIVTAVFRDALAHYNNVVHSLLNISSPFFIGYPRLDFLTKDDEIYIQLFDSEQIKGNLCTLFGKEYNEKTSERDIRNAIANVRNIKTTDELEKKYPQIYCVYSELIKPELDKKNSYFQIIEKYKNSFEYFITDLCDEYELIINNLARIDIALKNNKYIVEKKREPNFYYNMLYEIVAVASLNTHSKNLVTYQDINIFDSNIIKMYNELQKEKSPLMK